MNRPPTLKEIAAIAGVHQTTLSRALRGHPEVSSKKAEELRRLAEKMGYTPDPMLSALAAYRTSRRPAAFHSLLAWLNPNPDAAYAKLWRTRRNYWAAAEKRATQLGFKLEMKSLVNTIAGGRHMNSMLRSQNISGVIVGPTSTLEADWRGYIDWKQLSVIRIGESVRRIPLHCIVANRSRDMFRLMKELKNRGYVRPGFFMSDKMDERSGMQWSAAYLRAQLAFPAKHRISPNIFPEPTEKTVEGRMLANHARLAKWVKRIHPDVIITIGDNLLCRTLEEIGLRVPDDIGIAVLIQPEAGPLLTGMDENSTQIGSGSIDYVVAMMNRQERGIPLHPRTELIDSEWREAGSLRAGTGLD